MDTYIKLRALITTAVEALSENKLRSLLSLSGIMIGIASIVLVVSVNESGRQLIFKELETFGLTSIWISRDWTDYYDQKYGAVYGTGLFNEDYQYIRQQCCASLKRLSPIITLLSDKSVSFRGKDIRANVIGVNEEFDLINNETLAQGRFISSTDIKQKNFVTVISQDVEKVLMESGVKYPIGEQINIADNWFTIVGVIKNKSRDFISSIGANKTDPNIRMLTPYTTIQNIKGNNREISYFQGQAKDIDAAELAVYQVKNYLTKKYKNHFSYKGETMVQYIDTANNILKNISLVGLVTALVSLVVGGLAVLNVMFMSVVERTREIGIRKAIGAKNRDILTQFVLESVLITIIGGVLGISLAYLSITSVSLIYHFDVSTSQFGVLIALISTLTVGFFSGLYPAIKAANLKPIESLRYD
ncbi:ABC transporter permease [Catenovulum sediminis]|uniref:ABC transporter permease n=1 Tax=Catenovulum sediminis TaxID=1740262 RepID=A0ABV1RCH0_9ALTE|nr:ABC transporter permease [Catenovulum sediminis]